MGGPTLVQAPVPVGPLGQSLQTKTTADDEWVAEVEREPGLGMVLVGGGLRGLDQAGSAWDGGDDTKGPVPPPCSSWAPWESLR